MELDDLKSNWKKVDASNKSQQELLLMTKIKNHPKLNRIRLQLIVETVFLIVFLLVYYDFFDGSKKPLWLNGVLIASTVLFLLNDIIGWVTLRNPIQKEELFNSLTHFYTKLKRLSISSFITSFTFGASIILFFSFSINYSNVKYILLTGIIITFIISLYLSRLNWNNRIRQIKEVVTTFDMDSK